MIPTESGRRRSFFVFTPFASALTKLTTTSAERFAGSVVELLLVEYDRWVLFPAENAIAGYYRDVG